MAAKGYTTEILVEAEIGSSIDASTTPNTTQVATWIEEEESIVDERTGTTFTAGTASAIVMPFNEHNVHSKSKTFYTESLRADTQRLSSSNSVFLLDSKDNPVKPVISISSLERNTAGGTTSSDSWDSLTENTGSGGDFTFDPTTGLLTFHQNRPTFGLDRGIRWSGNYGYSSVPLKVQMLTTKLVARRILKSKAKGSMFGSVDSISIESLSIRKDFGGMVNYLQDLDREIEDLFKEISGTFSADIVK